MLKHLILILAAITLYGCSSEDYASELASKHARAIDSCDAAYGQGVSIKPPTLAEEGSQKYKRTLDAKVSLFEDRVIVTLDSKKRCRLDPTTYEVLEKL